MPFFSICSSIVSEGRLAETLASMALAEPDFGPRIGVLSRRFYQCVAQPHVIWAITQWQSEKHHHDAAQSLMKSRRDDRIAAIRFGPEPYFEIFCDEDTGLQVGGPSTPCDCIIIAHGLVGESVRTEYLRLQRQRIGQPTLHTRWMRVYRNRYQAAEFVALLGLRNQREYQDSRETDGLLAEEWLLTGLRKPLGMSYLASYNQFICAPLALAEPLATTR